MHYIFFVFGSITIKLVNLDYVNLDYMYYLNFILSVFVYLFPNLYWKEDKTNIIKLFIYFFWHMKKKKYMSYILD